MEEEQRKKAFLYAEGRTKKNYRARINEHLNSSMP